MTAPALTPSPRCPGPRRRRLPAWLLPLLIGLWAWAGGGLAQAATYTFRSEVFAWESAANTVNWDQTCTSYPRDDDKATITFTGGFTFKFAGTSYSSVRVLTNGALQFGTDTGFHRNFSNTTLPAAAGSAMAGCTNAAPTALLMAYWADLDPGKSTGGGVTWEQKGTAPNRRVVVSWNDVFQYLTTTPYTFQIILYENGEFVYQYGNANASGSNATIGVQVSSTDNTLYAFNSGYNANGTAIRWFIPSGTPSLLAEYRLDQFQYNGTPGEVVDSTGHGYNGIRVGASTASTATSHLCRAVDIPANTTNTINAVDTALDVDSAIGSSGSIAFWVNSRTAWASGANAMLLDATTVANAPFYLMRNSTGGLRWVVADSAGTVLATTLASTALAANTWVHITVTWRLASGSNQSTLRIYLNGILVASQSGTTTGNIAGSLSSLYLGDNRSGVTPSGGSLNSANGQIDEVQVFNYELSAAEILAQMASTHTCLPPLHHVELVPAGTSGSTCSAMAVTLRACADAACASLLTSYTGTVTLSAGTGKGDWSAGSGPAPLGVLANGVANDGAAIYTFAASDLGRANLLFTHTLAQDVSFTAVDPLQPASITTSSAVAFRDNAFVFAEDLSNLVSGSWVAVAGRPHDMSLSLIRKDPSTGSCGVATNYTGTRSLKLWRTDSGGTWVAPTVVSPALAVPASAPAANNITLPFVAGVAPFTLATTNIGRYSFSAQDDSLTQAATVVSGSSSALTVRPFALLLRNVRYGSRTNPAGSAATDAVFAPAGASFSLTASAVGWTSALLSNGVDPGNTGTPSASATESLLTLGGLLSGFNSPVTLRPLAASQTPATGSLGSLSNNLIAASAFSGGSATLSNLQYSEVGSFKLDPTAVVSDFLGSGLALDALVLNAAGGQDSRVGRFIPAGFTLSLGSVGHRSAASCVPASTFTYLDEGFQLGFTLSAVNALGGVTRNYNGAFAKLDPTSAASWKLAGLAGSTPLRTDTSPARLVVPSATGAWLNGTASAVAISAKVSRASVADGPLDAVFGIAPQDSDGVGMLSFDLDTSWPADAVADHSRVAAVALRHGRLRLTNAIGAQNRALAVPVTAQYWNGSAWAPNTLDACTRLPASAVSFANHRKWLTPSDSQVLGTSFTLANGQTKLWLQAPAAGHRGTVDVALSLGSSAPPANCLASWAPSAINVATSGAGLAFLRGDWCGPGSDKDPLARASFGLFRGADAQLNARETF